MSEKKSSKQMWVGGFIIYTAVVLVIGYAAKAKGPDMKEKAAIMRECVIQCVEDKLLKPVIEDVKD